MKRIRLEGVEKFVHQGEDDLVDLRVLRAPTAAVDALVVRVLAGGLVEVRMLLQEGAGVSGPRLVAQAVDHRDDADSLFAGGGGKLARPGLGDRPARFQFRVRGVIEVVVHLDDDRVDAQFGEGRQLAFEGLQALRPTHEQVNGPPGRTRSAERGTRSDGRRRGRRNGGRRRGGRQATADDQGRDEENPERGECSHGHLLPWTYASIPTAALVRKRHVADKCGCASRLLQVAIAAGLSAEGTADNSPQRKLWVGERAVMSAGAPKGAAEGNAVAVLSPHSGLQQTEETEEHPAAGYP